MKHRKKDRRTYSEIPEVPLLTRQGLVREDRRQYIERRERNRRLVRFKA